MIGTIRKHSKWLWWVIAGLTIISFIGWNIAPASRNGGVGGNGAYGMLYGHKITRQEYINARNDFYLFYWFHNNEVWPDRNANIKPKAVDEQIYLRLMLTQKASTMGIYVSDEAAAKVAGELLGSLGRNGQAVPFQTFVQKVLTPEGLTAADFERFARNDLVIQQLVQMLGLTGSLITPQEAAAAYQRMHQEVAAQVVFFSASNYLSQIPVTPALVAEYYTNYMSQYRLPDRVQVNYVEFNLTNFLAQARAWWAKTNLDEVVNAAFQQYGMDAFPDAKTPEAAKAEIRDQLIRQRALADARTQANDFANAVVNQTPQRPENLATVAKPMGLTVQHHRAVLQSLWAGGISRAGGVHQVRVRADAGRPVCRADSGRLRVLRNRARKTIAQRNPDAGPNPRPRDAGLPDGASHHARAARRVKFRSRAGRSIAGRPQFRVGLHRRRPASRITAAVFLEHAGIAGTSRPRQPRAIPKCRVRHARRPRQRF